MEPTLTSEINLLAMVVGQTYQYATNFYLQLFCCLPPVVAFPASS